MSDEQLERIRLRLVHNERLTAAGQLLPGLAHDINTPLSVVITNLAVLSGNVESLSVIARAAQAMLPDLLARPGGAAMAGPLDAAVHGSDLDYMLEDLPDLLKESTAAARRVSDLVGGIATFAHSLTDEPCTVVEVRVVLDAALTLVSNALKQAHVIREYGDTPPIFGRQSELTELFVHLLINAGQALKGRASMGTVTVTSVCEAGSVVVRISDTGAGVSATNLPRVFEPFFTTHAPPGGTGMGLAVCAAIVASHAGSIGLDSEPGVGTTVTVSLPAVDRTR